MSNTSQGETLSLVLNAGGLSTRMGQSKALLPVPPSGQPLIHTVMQRLAALPTGAVLAVSNDNEIRALLTQSNVNVIPDLEENLGPIGGLWSALEWLSLREISGWMAFVACDMPLVEAAPMQMMFERALRSPSTDIVVPRANGRLHPLFALYHTRCLDTVRQCIQVRSLRMTALVDVTRVSIVDEADYRSVDPELTSLINVNTPADWHSVLRLLERRG